VTAADYDGRDSDVLPVEKFIAAVLLRGDLRAEPRNPKGFDAECFQQEAALGALLVLVANHPRLWTVVERHVDGKRAFDQQQSQQQPGPRPPSPTPEQQRPLLPPRQRQPVVSMDEVARIAKRRAEQFAAQNGTEVSLPPDGQ
jgi:hypothetical protein